jgi:hypothetical protein
LRGGLRVHRPAWLGRLRVSAAGDAYKKAELQSRAESSL